MMRSSVLILFISRPFLEESLRDIPIFFSFFPARSFGIELEYNGGVLRFLPEICVRFFWFCSFLEERKSRENRRFCKAKYGTKKTSCST